MDNYKKGLLFLLSVVIVCAIGIGLYRKGFLSAFSGHVNAPSTMTVTEQIPSEDNVLQKQVSEPLSVTAGHAAVTHISTPKHVRAIYMTSWVASQKEWRMRLATFVRESDINSIVIDVKDYSGVISFKTGDPVLAASGAEQVRVPDMAEFIAELHRMGIYVIARISVFQDPIYAQKYPEQAVQNRSGGIWTDRNGLHFIDPGATPYWGYIVRLSKAAIAVGFDELNFDYVRYPTDGNMQDIRYPVSGKELQSLAVSLQERRPTGSVLPTPKQVVLERFFKHLSKELRPLGIPMSADLFGMTMTARDDVSIGQVLESALPYFDYICPMVYPSHYPSGFNGYAKPAQYPYEIIYFVMKAGAERAKAAGYSSAVLRPWLQDFNLGATYDESKVRAQIKAAHDAGIYSWLIWDPRNRYTRVAYYGWDATVPSLPTADPKTDAAASEGKR